MSLISSGIQAVLQYIASSAQCTRVGQVSSILFSAAASLMHVHRSAVSLDEDVNMDKELVAHGVSNLAAEFLGTVYAIVLRPNVLTRHKAELSGLCQYTLVSHFTRCFALLN